MPLDSLKEIEFPTCNILGVEIAGVSKQWVLNFIVNNIRELSGNYMCVSNVHTTIMSYEDSKYCSIQNGGILAIPDGGPLATIAKKRGYTLCERIPGPTLMEGIFAISEELGYTHFFYGSTQDTLLKLERELNLIYPKLNIVGSISPPFREISSYEDEEIVQEINRIKPDFVWVGLGAPKQELWMSEHKNRVHGFMIGVGAGFDYFSGKLKRAPMWMQNNNLEWLFRLLQDPRRLFKRYLVTNTKFIWLIEVLKK